MAAWEWWRLVVALVFSFVSYCVYRGRNWARLTVIALGLCLAGLVMWQLGAAVIDIAGRHNESTSTRSFGLWQLVEIANSLGLGISQFLAPLAFVVCVLCHRDVAAAFRSGINERSNQAMQRTPTGSSPSTSNE
jgi:drug/metabolite transporter (DMT)-like permease